MAKVPGRVELEILEFISQRHPITVREVAEHIAGTTGQARTTVLTVMERLRRKGFLSRRKQDGVNHYSPRVGFAQLLERLVGDFVEGMLGGAVSPFVAYLHKSARLDDEEIRQLKAAVAELETRAKRRP